MLSDAEARQLAGHRVLYEVVIEGRPDWCGEDGWRYDCRGDGPACRSLWVRDGDDLATRYYAASGRIRVEGTSLITYILVHERERGLIEE
jgi:hypothetical protein